MVPRLAATSCAPRDARGARLHRVCGEERPCDRRPACETSEQAPSKRARARPRTRREAVARGGSPWLGTRPHRLVRRQAGEVRPSWPAAASAAGQPVAEGAAEVGRRSGATEKSAGLRGVSVGLTCSSAGASHDCSREDGMELPLSGGEGITEDAARKNTYMHGSPGAGGSTGRRPAEGYTCTVRKESTT